VKNNLESLNEQLELVEKQKKNRENSNNTNKFSSDLFQWMNFMGTMK